ncbi:uncharacterized protein LOC134812685 [Bolinopsis microptera]|uniref:uncharacterized protein LOC134812685 n=1 Tax=Bolinopsis microptera TaxID=2820187 RepID=UPI003079B215
MSLIKLVVLFAYIALATSKPSKDPALPVDDLKDLLLASMENTITLTELATQQATKVSAITTSLTEARTEIDQLKSKINKLEEGQTEQDKNLSDTKVEIIGLTSDLSAKIGALEEGQTEQDKNLNGTTSEIIGLTSGLATALTQMEDFKNESQTEVESLKSEVDDLTVKVEEDSWPEGSYCILGSGGSCPDGFTRYQGWTKAIWTYRNSNGYTQAATFGDSIIGCHSGRGPSNARNDWNTDIVITSCCK